jgi:glycosyltransferase involved in cell wall biosynthesis
MGKDVKPTVSIMLITYNHEKYIAQALDSVLMQETQYDYEINVIEDCSTDRTRDIVMKYAERYPDKVKPYFNKKNIGFEVTQKNFFQGFKTLTGDYIAILEGDDYWTSPNKLEKQISFLEEHREYVACAHNVIKLYEDGSKEPHRFLYWPGKPADHTIEDIIYMRSYFHCTTLMFRNVFRGNPPPQFENRWSCEIFVAIAHAQFGKIRYFDEDMSIYRAHPGGRFSNMTILDGWFFNIGGLRRYNQWLAYRHLKAFSGSIIQYCNVVLRQAGKEYDTPSLTARQVIKYASIRTCYQIIFSIMNAKDQVIEADVNIAKASSITRNLAYSASSMTRYLGYSARSMTRNLAYSVCFASISAVKCIFEVSGAILAGVFRGASLILPASYRTMIKKALWPEDVHHLHWLWTQGALFTPKGSYHFRELLRSYVRTLSRGLTRLVGWCVPKGFKAAWWARRGDARTLWKRCVPEFARRLVWWLYRCSAAAMWIALRPFGLWRDLRKATVLVKDISHPNQPH